MLKSIISYPIKNISVIYHITANSDEIEKISRDIALEQTVEVPDQLVTSPKIREEIVGKVESIQALEESVEGQTLNVKSQKSNVERLQNDVFRVVIKYNLKLTGFQIPQMLNLVYGNISIKHNIKLVDILFPEEYLGNFRGPNFGVSGIRGKLGVYGRPLLATALKPMGSSIEELSQIAGNFSLGGGDIVKDDHGLIDEGFSQFRERVSHCQEAIEEGNSQTGRRTLYFPNVTAPIDQIEGYVEFLINRGIPGILIAPFLVGLDCVRSLAEKYPILIMAHPAFSGTYFHDRKHGMSPGVLLGTIFRLIGSDASIFPNYGGRFSFTQEECHEISRHLKCPLGSLKPAFPTPAGGMKLNNVTSMADDYGEDVILLIGGALLSHSSNLRESTKVFMEKFKGQFLEKLEDPNKLEAYSTITACDLTEEKQVSQILKHLAFTKDFAWQGRSPTVYKGSSELPFENVTRFELIGKAGEDCSFDLRYFQIEPGGYTSLEKHLHTHTIICARGHGALRINNQTIQMKPLDIAYVSPLDVHQLGNESSEPFGFFCIVDRDRDRPIKP